MCSDHSTSVPVAAAAHPRRRKPHIERKSVESQSLDLEKEGMVMPNSTYAPTLDLSHYRMVDGMFRSAIPPVFDKVLTREYRGLALLLR